MIDECAKLRGEIVELEKKLRATIEKKESLKMMVSRVEVEEYELTSQLKEKKLAFRTITESMALPPPLPAPSESQAPEKTLANQRMRGVVGNVKEFRGLVEKLPLIKVSLGEVKDKSEENSYVLNKIMGPHDPEAIMYQDADLIGTKVAARTISTYPLNSTHKKREGNPICDHYIVEVVSEYTFVAIGDGCNWGSRPLEASVRATEGFISHTILNYSKSESTHDIGELLLESFASAHNEILNGKREIWEAGTTTLIGSMIYPAGKSEYIAQVLSIGDCKCFHWDASNKKITDITKGNRGNLTDARDPGGRIGPYVGDGMPDTRNLALFHAKCRENDLLIYCTDGVHDNLDAESLGIDPGEFIAEFEGMTWEEAEATNKELAQRIKGAFYEARLEMLLNDQYVADAKERVGEEGFVPSAPTPKDVVDLILDYCVRVTMSSRDFMESNPGLKLPSDYKLYPGKMDHSTCVVVRVGK